MICRLFALYILLANKLHFACKATAITSGITTITSVVSQVWTTMTGNPLVMAFVGASLLGVGIGVVRKLTKGKA